MVGKLLIFILDAAIVLTILWVVFLQGRSRWFWYLAGLILIFVGLVGVWVELRKRERSKRQVQTDAEVESERVEAARRETTRLNLLAKERDSAAEQERNRRKLLADEHEARRPLCAHCGRKTGSMFRHRRVDGSADRRYHDNPLLCNQCFQPYEPVRPWNLPETKPETWE